MQASAFAISEPIQATSKGPRALQTTSYGPVGPSSLKKPLEGLITPCKSVMRLYRVLWPFLICYCTQNRLVIWDYYKAF